MRTTFVSTLALWNSSKTSLDKMQTGLVKANKELVTGRESDVGLKLGYKTGQTLSLRQDRAEIDALVDSNASILLRMKSSTTALDQVRTNGDKFMDALIATPLSSSSLTTVMYQAKANLQSMISSMNSNVGGQYIFGGINSQEKPLNDYSGGTAAIASAFRSTFGFGVNDAAVSTITPDDMRAFLDGSFAALFEGANWQDWSNASSQNIQSRISATERVEASTNANDLGIRKMAMAYTMISELGLDRLGETTREALVNKAIATFSEATTGVTTMQSRLGAVQEKVEEADERMSLQKDILDAKIIHLEAVDPAEAKIRVDRLMTQIQTSYSLTAQLRTMSLINYL